MPGQQIEFYYGNVMADAIGPKHGITQRQLDKLLKDLPEKTRKLKSFPQIRNKESAYRKLPFGTETPRQVHRLVAELKDRCEILVVFGIGGSALGSIALQTALNSYMYNLDDKRRRDPRLFVFDNIDPSQLTSFLKWLKDSGRLKKTIFNVISRTGTPAETMSQFMIIRRLLSRRFGARNLRNHVVVTTCFNNNPLHRIAVNAHLHCLEIPEDVVGRFSVLSAVGLFSAAMCGINIDSILEGAKDMDTRVSCRNLRRNPAAINAAINHHFYKKGKNISVMMPYSFHLKDLADWYRQLWAESLGKAKGLNRRVVQIGPTPVRALGTTDQHSQVQLYREGPNDKLFTFLQVNNFDRDLKIGLVSEDASELAFLAGKDLSTLFNNEKRATEYAILQSKRPCLTVFFDEVNAYTVGQFIYLYEVTTSFTGALFGINPYNQLAVQFVRNAITALKGQRGYYKSGYTYKQWAKEIRTLTKVNKRFLV
ncbi:Glucose-6-phosphate isomerase [subsurface metagenome]